MKALSIKQPWATLIVLGRKDIENRKWSTNHRGPLLIHASGQVDERALDEYAQTLAHLKDSATGQNPLLLTRGIIGMVTLVDIVRESNSRWFTGPCGWVLADPRPLPFVSWKGSLGLFEVPESEVMPDE